MATAKKRGAPASASKPERQQLDRAAAKRAERDAKRAAFHERRKEVTADIVQETDTQARHILRASGISESAKPATEWSEKLGTQLFSLIVIGTSLEKISALPGMPELHTMLRWLGTASHPFGKLYREAKDMMVPFYEERAVEVATKPLMGEIIVERDSEELGRTVETRRNDNVERSRLAFNAYQWALAHLRPNKHGRNADPQAGKPNEQLKALFDALSQGPTE